MQESILTIAEVWTSFGFGVEAAIDQDIVTDRNADAPVIHNHALSNESRLNGQPSFETRLVSSKSTA